MGRRFGGVKVVSAESPRPVRRLGGVVTKPGTGVADRQCKTCVGRVVDGTWIHDDGCPMIVVLWKRMGYTAARWTCPHRCRGYDAGTFLTHSHDCAFWTEMDQRLWTDMVHLPRGQDATEEADARGEGSADSRDGLQGGQ